MASIAARSVLSCPVFASPEVSAFFTTAGVVAIAEIGDKTQLATTALAARYDAILIVTAASTLGLMLANVPVVFLGKALMRRLPLNLARYLAASAFLLLALVLLLTG